MIKSENKKLNMILKFMGAETINDVQIFALNALNRSFIEFQNEIQITTLFDDWVSKFFSCNSSNNIDMIRYYTGIAFRDVNSVLRNTWNYETNGLLTEDKKKSAQDLATGISTIIDNTDSINLNIKTYRGTNLAGFSDYGINQMEDLLQLKDQFYFESAFISTSLLRENSFFNKSLEWHDACNIEIEYLISEESNDGIPLITDNLSYSKKQCEFLINKGSLAKIIDVKLNSDGTKAYLKMLLIPKKIWDCSLKNKLESTISKK